MRCTFVLAAATSLLLLTTACSSHDPGPSTRTAAPAATNSTSPAPLTGNISLYTSIEQSTVDAMVQALKNKHQGLDVQVFRAPTGQINARLAGEQRSGGVAADVIWGPDPLTFYGYDDQKLLQAWTPAHIDKVPVEARGDDTFWGTAVLPVILVVNKNTPFTPTKWTDLADPRLRGQVEFPSPTFAASGLGMLGYFFQQAGYTMDFVHKLKDNAAVQVDSPDTVVADVAAGRKQVGVALDFSARQAAAKGSPIDVIAPDPGPIAVYGDIGVTANSKNAVSAKAFADFVLSDDGQQVLAGQKRQPVSADFPSGDKKFVTPDWAALAKRKQELLDDYQTIFIS
jgi:iron(III) transport system substrate-binding protein